MMVHITYFKEFKGSDRRGTLTRSLLWMLEVYGGGEWCRGVVFATTRGSRNELEPLEALE